MGFDDRPNGTVVPPSTVVGPSFMQVSLRPDHPVHQELGQASDFSLVDVGLQQVTVRSVTDTVDSGDHGLGDVGGTLRLRIELLGFDALPKNLFHQRMKAIERFDEEVAAPRMLPVEQLRAVPSPRDAPVEHHLGGQETLEAPRGRAAGRRCVFGRKTKGRIHFLNHRAKYLLLAGEVLVQRGS